MRYGVVNYFTSRTKAELHNAARYLGSEYEGPRWTLDRMHPSSDSYMIIWTLFSQQASKRSNLSVARFKQHHLQYNMDPRTLNARWITHLNAKYWQTVDASFVVMNRAEMDACQRDLQSLSTLVGDYNSSAPPNPDVEDEEDELWTFEEVNDPSWQGLPAHLKTTKRFRERNDDPVQMDSWDNLEGKTPYENLWMCSALNDGYVLAPDGQITPPVLAEQILALYKNLCSSLITGLGTGQRKRFVDYVMAGGSRTPQDMFMRAYTGSSLRSRSLFSDSEA